MKTVEENNAMIAEFMNCKIVNGVAFRKDNQNSSYVEDLQYYTSWDWLFPVVQKINSMNAIIDIKFDEYKYCSVRINDFSGYSDNHIQAVYSAVIEFINWYNTQSK